MFLPRVFSLEIARFHYTSSSIKFYRWFFRGHVQAHLMRQPFYNQVNVIAPNCVLLHFTSSHMLPFFSSLFHCNFRVLKLAKIIFFVTWNFVLQRTMARKKERLKDVERKNCHNFLKNSFWCAETPQSSDWTNEI